MSKSINNPKSRKSESMYAAIGVDISDRKSCWVGIGDDGEVSGRGTVRTRGPELEAWAMSVPRTVMAIEAGPHSPWISRLLARAGHEVIVGNPAKIPSISRSRAKTDWRDAEQLARLARFDRTMLHEIHHRSEQAQRDLQVIRTRDAAVDARRKLVNHVRATVKAHGELVPSCSTRTFVNRTRAVVSPELVAIVAPVLSALEVLSTAIRTYDREIETLATTRYPETRWLTQVRGVGALTALAYVLVLERASRFNSSRMVGPYLGLTPAKDQSGDSDPQKGISKEGDRLMRRLLVQSAHYILGPFGIDSDLRRHGLAIAGRGGKNAKKRAAVAVARKLAVLLHRLWISHDEYVPLFNYRNQPSSAAA